MEIDEPIPFRQDGKLNFDIVAPMASADGYGYSAEELVRAASLTGANIGYICHDWQDRRFTGQDIQDLELERHQVGDKEVLVVYFIPYAFYHFQSKINIGMTMFETTEIPDVWAQFCTIPKGLIVPTEFCKEVFQKKLPDKQIEVVPLGVNLNTYYMVERQPSNVFTFLMAGLLHYRKGAEFAVKAFQEEFEPDEPVRLVLKTRRGFLDTGKEDIFDPRISVVNADYDRQDMLDLYHAGDCFIACSRGEAAGLTPREAMATGLPAIVTDWSGLKEIADPAYSYPLKVETLEPAPAVCTSYDQGITQGQPIGDFARPSVPHLRELMRHIYENPEEARQKGLKAAMEIQNKWNYGYCANKWLEAIERIHDA